MDLNQIKSPLGMIAGNGNFPFILLEQAKRSGLDVVVAAHRGETDRKIEELASATEWVRIGQIKKIIKFFRRNNVQQMLFLGGLTKSNLVGNFRPDLCAIRVLSKLIAQHDDAVLSALADEFERHGFKVVSPAQLLTECVAGEGKVTTRGLSEQEKKNAQIGWRAAKAIGELDIGQGVVVDQQVVIAVEAVEGTDKMLERVAPYKLKSGVLVKVLKPSQDLRVDLPSVGPRTIELMRSSNNTALVLEAGGAMIVEPVETIRLANSYGIAIEGWR